jgi:WD40 repeat protein
MVERVDAGPAAIAASGVTDRADPAVSTMRAGSADENPFMSTTQIRVRLQDWCASRRLESDAGQARQILPQENRATSRISLFNSQIIIGLAFIVGVGWWLSIEPGPLDAAKPSRLELRGHASRVHSIVFAPDGKTVATCGGDATVKFWHIDRNDVNSRATGATVDSTLPHGFEVLTLACSPDGKLLATLGIDTLSLWSCHPHGYELAEQIRGPSQLSLAWAPDGRSLAVGLVDGRVQVLDMPGARPRKVLCGHTDMVRRLAFTADGRLLASSGMDGTVRLWDVALGRELGVIGETTGAFHAIACSPDGRWLALAEYGVRPADVILWDLRANRIRSRLAGHANGISSLAFSREGDVLASGSLDQTVRLWSPETGEVLAILWEPSGKIRSLALSPDSTMVAYSLGDSVKIWERGAVASSDSKRLPAIGLSIEDTK